MTWNYRVIEKNIEYKVDCSEMLYDETIYEIHECYYDESGNIKFWSENPITPYGEGDYRDLKQDLQYMLDAFKLPVLKESELPNSGDVTSGNDYLNNLLESEGLK